MIHPCESVLEISLRVKDSLLTELMEPRRNQLCTAVHVQHSRRSPSTTVALIVSRGCSKSSFGALKCRCARGERRA
jgi:hypothetical protein